LQVYICRKIHETSPKFGANTAYWVSATVGHQHMVI
jgi:hypothetical protein